MARGVGVEMGVWMMLDLRNASSEKVREQEVRGTRPTEKGRVVRRNTCVCFQDTWKIVRGMFLHLWACYQGGRKWLFLLLLPENQQVLSYKWQKLYLCQLEKWSSIFRPHSCLLLGSQQGCWAGHQVGEPSPLTIPYKVFPARGYYSAIKKWGVRRSSAICNILDEPGGHCTKWTKPGQKDKYHRISLIQGM